MKPGWQAARVSDHFTYFIGSQSNTTRSLADHFRVDADYFGHRLLAARLKPLEHSPSSTPETKRPLQFMVGRFDPLKWNKNAPPGRRIRIIS